jgi:farnesyl diphosphate synthase
MEFTDYLEHFQSRVNKTLDHWLPKEEQQPAHLHAAMRYSVLGEGKRIRPVLVYASGHAFGIDFDQLDGPAAAVEMIHAYSLIHDDLPAMDDDDLRRGRPTCHKAFDEATAILAGDALQALAYEVLAKDSNILVDSSEKIKMINTLASASGSLGMAGGQAIDLDAVGKSLSIEQLETMHRHKTGALISASVELGALSSGQLEPEIKERIVRYADCIGLAFQIRDDILDIEGDTEIIGKPQGSDQERNKPTYPNLLGMEGAREAANTMHQMALDSLDIFDDKADILRWIADYIVKRNK